LYFRRFLRLFGFFAFVGIARLAVFCTRLATSFLRPLVFPRWPRAIWLFTQLHAPPQTNWLQVLIYFASADRDPRGGVFKFLCFHWMVGARIAHGSPSLQFHPPFTPRTNLNPSPFRSVFVFFSRTSSSGVLLLNFPPKTPSFSLAFDSSLPWRPTTSYFLSLSRSPLPPCYRVSVVPVSANHFRLFTV